MKFDEHKRKLFHTALATATTSCDVYHCSSDPKFGARTIGQANALNRLVD